mgnify:FL=1
MPLVPVCRQLNPFLYLVLPRQPAKTKIRPKGYWSRVENRQRFLNEFAKELGFDPTRLENWKRITARQIQVKHVTISSLIPYIFFSPMLFVLGRWPDFQLWGFFAQGTSGDLPRFCKCVRLISSQPNQPKQNRQRIVRMRKKKRNKNKLENREGKCTCSQEQKKKKKEKGAGSLCSSRSRCSLRDISVSFYGLVRRLRRTI